MKSPYSNFVVIDVETGGLPNATKKAVFDVALTEVAFVAINKDLEIIDQKSWMIKPYSDKAEYSKGAEIASGISKQMCIDQGMDLKVAVQEMIIFLKKYKEGSSLPILLGHNFCTFDSNFMVNAFEFCKEDLLKYVNPDPEDTLKWGRLCWTESNNYKLGTCCQNAGITLKDAHRALTDTIATAELWIYFMKNLRGTGTSIINEEAPKKFRHTFEL